MPLPRHILVFRFSALGDVAMAVPVVKCLLEDDPGLEISFVSDPFMEPLFAGIARLHFYGADTRKDFKGLAGLYSLARRIRKDIDFDAVADLHNVLRTKLLRLFLAGRPTASIDKGRKEKKEATRPVNKKLRPLKTTFRRYADVFVQLGLSVVLDNKKGIVRRKVFSYEALPGLVRSSIKIGIAPFARHAPKMYPLEKMRKVVEMLAKLPAVQVVLFGSRNEAGLLNSWEKEMLNVLSMAGKTTLPGELDIISTLDVMVSMDSANMHLASLSGIPVVSIWGGTHPYLGFYGWGQPYANAVQLDLPCRPSSVFGNKECPVHGKEGCMEGITPEMIYGAVKEIVHL